MERNRKEKKIGRRRAAKDTLETKGGPKKNFGLLDGVVVSEEQVRNDSEQTEVLATFFASPLLVRIGLSPARSLCLVVELERERYYP